MAPYGYDEIVKTLKNLADTRQLSHAYVFFGEPQIGKFLCAHSFANYLEYGIFEEPTRPLQETLVVDIATTHKNEEESVESIGIQTARDIASFIRQKSIHSLYRTVIIRDAEWLTDQAQNALLKILEEPPEGSVVIFVVTDPSVLLPAVVSRVQKIYFKTLSELAMLDFCDKYDIIKESSVIQDSFGRIGRLRKLQNPSKQDETIQHIIISIQKSVHNDMAREKVVDMILAFSQKNPENLIHLCEALMIVLRKEKQYVAMAEVVRLIRTTQTLTLSKRIHLKKLLCLIT